MTGNGRLEYKYLIPVEFLPEFRRTIDPFLEMDGEAKKMRAGEYTVRSIYFDTTNLTAYHEKIEGVATRKKLRIRAYNQEQKHCLAFLEIKRKHNDTISKNRAPLLYEHAEDLLESGDTHRYIFPHKDFPHAREDARRFLFHVHRKVSYPTLLVTYEREAYHGKLNPSFRLTLDKNLRYRLCSSISDLYCDEKLIQPLSKHFILEVKFYSIMPVWLASILGSGGFKRQSVSKYCIGIEEFARRNPFAFRQGKRLNFQSEQFS